MKDYISMDQILNEYFAFIFHKDDEGNNRVILLESDIPTQYNGNKKILEKTISKVEVRLFAVTKLGKPGNLQSQNNNMKLQLQYQEF